MTAPIVGRESELAAAQVFLEGVSEGARGLLVEGEAGIGKTAVWRSVLDEASARDYRVLACLAEQAEARLSFVGLNDLAGAVADEVLPALPEPQRAALELALVRSGGGRRRGRTPDPKAVSVAFHSLVLGLAEASPVLIAVDDVQWLDAATNGLLRFAARRLGGHPVGVLATVRAPTAAPDPLGLERAFAPDGLARVRLGPLSLDALRTMLELRLGHGYARPTLLRVAHASGGNPMLALEIARALGPAPRLEPGAPLPVPESLRELVATRIAELAPAGRKALLTAAALSHPTADVVERASSATGLLAAEDAGLVRVEDGRVVFAHPLYASAVYAAAASGRRRSLHARLSELVVDPEEQARHLALATTGPDGQVAARLEEGAGLARARGAWEASAELLEQASALTPSGDFALARERAVRAAEHYVHAGDRPRARALLEEVLSDPAAGTTRSKALRLLAQIRYNEDSFADAPRLLEEALEHAGDPELEATIELALAYVSFNHVGDFVGADIHAERGLTLATNLCAPALLADALAARAIVDFLIGRGVDWGKVEKSLALEDQDRLEPLEMRPSLIEPLLKLYVGHLAEAREKLATLRRASIDSGDESDIAFVLFYCAWLETQSGELAAAAAFSEEAAVHASLSGSQATRAFALSQRALVSAHAGEEAVTRAAVAEAAEICGRLSFWPPMLWVTAALALLELSLGDARAAWEAAAPLTAPLEETGVGEPLLHFFLPEALEALIVLGELDRAEQLIDSFEARAHDVDRGWALATGARCRGLLLAARGDLDGAKRALQRALVEHDRLEMPFAYARTLLADGQVRRRSREKRAARDSLEEAAALFEDMGAQLWAERAREELARSGVRRESGELTKTERRAAELAAEGLSNKEIAAALFVTVNTVEAHLSHAYAKLGVHSRTQLARRLSAGV